MNRLANGYTVIHGTIGPDLHPIDTFTLSRQITPPVHRDSQFLIVTTTPEATIEKEHQ
ncbi:MAG: hypothetical protein H6568_09970 [Lewinellaceae bacterium]|nr:hypothetical protein [Lewinellaceae bacterium]